MDGEGGERFSRVEALPQNWQRPFDRLTGEQFEQTYSNPVELKVGKTHLVAIVNPENRNEVTVYDGRGRWKRNEVVKGAQISIGRSTVSNFAIDDRSVSRMHAAVAPTGDGGITVRDRDSTNGTYCREVGRPPAGVELKLTSGASSPFFLFDIPYRITLGGYEVVVAPAEDEKGNKCIRVEPVHPTEEIPPMLYYPDQTGQIIIFFGRHVEGSDVNLKEYMPPEIRGKALPAISTWQTPAGERTVSRRHAELVVMGNVAVVHDLGSTNGTVLVPQSDISGKSR